ncbi:MAG TPA: hypothetical protein VJ085_00215 [Candidatus Acidoferrales bacterium]|nr:hypothetical protein [Candidatus Acidoferrales bacterium]
MRYPALLGSLFVAGLFIALPAAAEEFYLKDGSKIVGKIVAYETDSFRVETSFGFAVIYKDRIERIVFAEPARKEATPAAGSGAVTPTDSGPRSASTTPPVPPLPDFIIEHVSATEYVNETYHFQMFKPPTWRSYPEMVKPQTPLVAALGTPDETTLLLIGHEIFNGSLAEYARLAERSLERLYENYQREGEQSKQVAGMPAIERRFTGEAEGRFWTGVAIYFARGRQHYTFLGQTAAGETTNFQLAVLRKVVGTLAFLP